MLMLIMIIMIILVIILRVVISIPESENLRNFQKLQISTDLQTFPEKENKKQTESL
jgi:hypothetical protein